MPTLSNKRNKFVLLIEPGKITTINDALDLRDLGEMRVKRASRVSFNGKTKTWSVAIKGDKTLRGFPTRSEAIQAEIVHINKWLRRGCIPGNITNTRKGSI